MQKIESGILNADATTGSISITSVATAQMSLVETTCLTLVTCFVKPTELSFSLPEFHEVVRYIDPCQLLYTLVKYRQNINKEESIYDAVTSQ